jgi:hypothetical protein
MLVCFWPCRIYYSRLVKFVVIWYIFPVLVGMFYQSKSGNLNLQAKECSSDYEVLFSPGEKKKHLFSSKDVIANLLHRLLFLMSLSVQVLSSEASRPTYESCRTAVRLISIDSVNYPNYP